MSQLRFTDLLYPFHVRYEVVNLQNGSWNTVSILQNATMFREFHCLITTKLCMFEKVGDWYDRRIENNLEINEADVIFPGGTNIVPADTDLSDISTLKLNLTVVSILVSEFLSLYTFVQNIFVLICQTFSNWKVKRVVMYSCSGNIALQNELILTCLLAKNLFCYRRHHSQTLYQDLTVFTKKEALNVTKVTSSTLSAC